MMGLQSKAFDKSMKTVSASLLLPSYNNVLFIYLSIKIIINNFDFDYCVDEALDHIIHC